MTTAQDSSLQQFIDIDSSKIVSYDRDAVKFFKKYCIQNLPSISFSKSVLEVIYFDHPSSTESSLCTALINMVKSDDSTFRGLSICGFDTETSTDGNVELIQLSMNEIVILIHKRSGLFGSKALHQFLCNNYFGSWKIVFAGAELATADALDMINLGIPMVGLMDLTAIFSQQTENVISVFPKNSNCIPSLKSMFNETFNCNWHKSKEITLSDWSVSELSLQQIKYGALDAWTSYHLGLHAFCKLHPKGIFKMIFSTNDSKYLHVRDEKKELLVRQIIRQAEELSKKEPKCAEIDNIRLAGKGQVEVVSGAFANRLHRDLKKVEIRVISPGGSAEGVTISASIIQSKGRVSVLVFDASSLYETDTSHAVDLRRISEMRNDVARAVVNYWRKEADALGRYVVRITRQERIQLSKNYIKVRMYCHDKPDGVLGQVRRTASAMVRSHFVSLDFFPEEIRAKAASEIDSARQALSIGPLRTIFSLGWDLLSGGGFDNIAEHPLTQQQSEAFKAHSSALNKSQCQGLRNAFAYRVSVIKGPPGTGKTRTIAAIADVAQTGNRRVLIIAPSNSASRRILETLVKTGFEEACLIVSENYFFEWHEEAYTGQSIGHYVHTRASFADDQKGKQTKRTDHRAEAREEIDFRRRFEKEHVNKWLHVARGDAREDECKPDVVIGTYGSIALNGVNAGAGTSSWTDQVNNLVQKNSIDMLVIDETSQLWSGYGTSLLAQLPKLKNIVLVGDDAQLAPFGVDKVSALKSLFDVAIKHPSVPQTMLNITYRLSPPVAKLLSKVVYDDKLIPERVNAHDEAFQRNMNAFRTTLKVKDHPIHTIIERVCSSSSEDSFGSLTWIHMEAAPHKNPETHSLGNEKEAEIIISCVAQLLLDLYSMKSRYPDGASNPAATKIAIITGYLEQKDVLERGLSRRLDEMQFRGLGTVDLAEWVKSSMIINTVDSFQGQEADIVFISLVRSLADPALKGLGFASDQRRANVMLSRASQLMVVVWDAANAAKYMNSEKLLIPSMAYWCSNHASLFRIQDGSLRPVKLTDSNAAIFLRASAPTPTIAASPTIAANNSVIYGTDIQAEPRKVIPLDLTKGHCLLLPFAKRLVTILLGQPNMEMNLSQLSLLISRDLWVGRKSLIVPIREVPCVSLFQNHVEWVAKLWVDRTPSSSKQVELKDFAVSIRSEIQMAGGSIEMGVLGTIFPRAARPSQLRPLKEQVIEALGKEIYISKSTASLIVPFVKKVRSILYTEAGPMLLSKLGAVFPPNKCPVKCGLKKQLQIFFGNDIEFNGIDGIVTVELTFAGKVRTILEYSGYVLLRDLGLYFPIATRPTKFKSLKRYLIEEMADNIEFSPCGNYLKLVD